MIDDAADTGINSRTRLTQARVAGVVIKYQGTIFTHLGSRQHQVNQRFHPRP